MTEYHYEPMPHSERELPKFNLTVNTEILGDVISQSVTDMSGNVSRWVMNTRDAQIRLALIKLGWIPPLPPNP